MKLVPFQLHGIGRLSFIKSIQYVSIALSAVQLTNTATIAAVSLNDTVVFYRGLLGGGGPLAGENTGGFSVVSNTSIALTRGNDTNGSAFTGYAVVVECAPGVLQSCGTGSITLNGVTSNTATIPAVDPNNTVVVTLGTSYNQAGAVSEAATCSHIDLTDGVTLTATRAAASGLAISYYSYLEFN